MDSAGETDLTTRPTPMASAAIDAEALFRAHARFVAGFLIRIGCARGEVEDFVQEVFLTVHRRGGFRPGAAKPTTWLADIALGVVSTARRSRLRKPSQQDEAALDGAVASGASPFEATVARQALERVAKSLETLDLEHRAVFILFEVEGESCETIAAGLDIPVGTVYSRLHHARQAVRAAYERQRVERPALHAAHERAS